MNLDLHTATYDEFVTFVFDHYPEDEVNDKWYWKLDVEVDIEPRRGVAYLTRVLLEGSELLRSYMPRQIAEGINYLMGGSASDFLELLWDPGVPWPERERCILAIPQLYGDVLEGDPDGVGGCAYMLWDWVAYGYHCGNRDATKNPEDARVQDAMFKAITSLLHSHHPETQVGAIHGLGHLCHRESGRAIREFLASDRPVDSRVRTYAASVLEGEFQ